jgi:dimethylhistidine N-methyltransferase
MRILPGAAGAGRLTLYDFEPTSDRLLEDVLRGLGGAAKALPPKYFYDARGARLFEEICELEEYYPTRTEIGILRDRIGEIAGHIGRDSRLVEFGSGSGIKTMLLLEHLDRPAAYVPVDISRAQLLQFALSVAERFPALEVQPVCADYTGDFHLPAPTRPVARTVAFFPGSSIGNFAPAEARAFLRRTRSLCGEAGGFLVGVDRRKDPRVLERAYNDPAGVTAAFNRNLLVRINRECGADFDPGAFEHRAIYDEAEGRIEMRLVSRRAQRVEIPGPDGERVGIGFAAGEHITTEYSYKYDLPGFAALAAAAGWRVERAWSDEREWFSVLLLAPAE